MYKEAGVPLAEASAGAVLVHGRGATAESILQLAHEVNTPGVAYLAPQADGYSWYPNSFLAPLEANEPGISNGIAAVLDAIGALEAAGVPSDAIAVIGFSQGACLASETLARNPRRFGGLAALSGGLIGRGQIPGAAPPDDKRFEYDGSLGGTPVFIGCSDVDPHIPVSRVRKTADVFDRMGAEVDLRIYEGMGHTVNRDELEVLEELLGRLAGRAAGQRTGGST